MNYLKLSASIPWGLKITGTKSIALNDLNLDFDATLSNIEARLTYELTGNFIIDQSGGSEDGWTRFIVRKNINSALNFISNIKVHAEAPIKGLPATADEFILKLTQAPPEDLALILQAIEHKDLAALDRFKNQWYAEIKKAVESSFTFDLAYAFSQASQHESLIDIELNLNEASGRELAHLASSGDFSEIFDKYDPAFLKINEAVFTDKFRKISSLQINVLGWGYSNIATLIQDSEYAIEASEQGLVRVYTLDTQAKQKISKGGKYKETVESNFLLRFFGESFQDLQHDNLRSHQYFIQTIRRLGIKYELLSSDENTSIAELTRYLNFAEFLGILNSQSRTELITELKSQFPAGLGNVSLSYDIRYDDEALKHMFSSITDDELYNTVRHTLREFISAKYIGMKQHDWLARVGFAYLSPQLHEIFDKEGFTGLSKIKAVVLPAWFTKDSQKEAKLSSTDVHLLTTLCSIENKYAKLFVELNKTLKSSLVNKEPVDFKYLQKVSRKFVDMADDLDEWRENAFFVIFDKLARPYAERKSSVTLKITPPNGEMVTKILV